MKQVGAPVQTVLVVADTDATFRNYVRQVFARGGERVRAIRFVHVTGERHLLGHRAATTRYVMVGLPPRALTAVNEITARGITWWEGQP